MLRLFCPALIGELKNQKGILAAIDLYEAAGGKAELVVAGLWDPALPSSDRKKLEQHPRLRVLGALSEEAVKEQFDLADALVLFSRTEGEPMAVIEAMARGLPIIAADVGAVRAMTPEDPLNMIVPPGDVTALARAIAELARSPRARRRVPENRRRVELERSPEVHVRALEAVYRSVVNGSRSVHLSPVHSCFVWGRRMACAAIKKMNLTFSTV